MFPTTETTLCDSDFVWKEDEAMDETPKPYEESVEEGECCEDTLIVPRSQPKPTRKRPRGETISSSSPPPRRRDDSKRVLSDLFCQSESDDKEDEESDDDEDGDSSSEERFDKRDWSGKSKRSRDGNGDELTRSFQKSPERSPKRSPHCSPKRLVVTPTPPSSQKHRPRKEKRASRSQQHRSASHVQQPPQPPSESKSNDNRLPSSIGYAAKKQQPQYRSNGYVIPKNGSSASRSWYRRTPSHEPSSFHQRFRPFHRQVFEHASAVTVLAVDATTASHTLTNGTTSVSVDRSDPRRWKRQLVLDVQQFRVERLFVVDEVGMHVWREARNELNGSLSWERVKSLEPVLLEKEEEEKRRDECVFCQKKECHRWRAVNGIQRLLNFSVEPIRHGWEM